MSRVPIPRRCPTGRCLHAPSSTQHPCRYRKKKSEGWTHYWCVVVALVETTVRHRDKNCDKKTKTSYSIVFFQHNVQCIIIPSRCGFMTSGQDLPVPQPFEINRANPCLRHSQGSAEQRTSLHWSTKTKQQREAQGVAASTIHRRCECA